MTRPTSNAASADDDLYGGLAPARDVSSNKRRRPDADAAEATCKAQQQADATKSTKKNKTFADSAEDSDRSSSLDVKQTLDKLEKYLVVDKKFTKAITLFMRLVRSHLDEHTAPQMLETLRRVTTAKPQVEETPEFTQVISVLQSELTHKQILIQTSQEQQQELVAMWDEWQLCCLDLATDDTFVFAKAAKRVKQRLDQWIKQRQHNQQREKEQQEREDHDQEQDKDKELEHEDEESTDQETLRLMRLLMRLMTRHSLAWAKTIVEDVVQLATRNRLAFGPRERSQVDRWTATIQERRFVGAVNESLGVRGAHQRKNLVSHEALESATGIKVGQTFHPLFNRK